MAQGDPQRTEFPAITTETLEFSTQYIKGQNLDENGHRVLHPQVVYLKELPSYDDFFAKFLVPNQLCVLTESATRQWRSRQEWVGQDGSPNIEFLQCAFGSATVPVANCKSKEFSAHAKQKMKMSEFLSYWQEYREAGHSSAEKCLYLKDWHFTRDFPDYEAYSTCSFFCSDWMNEFWDVRKDIDDDYRFVYMGPKNSWTPFHADVFRSFSWSANICGRKRWIFFPPGEEEHLKDVHNNLAYDISAKELEDPAVFPKAHRVQHKFEIIQHPGETIFVPSGWHHQVENLEDTISINHNWLNGCNVRHCWTHLRSSLADVESEISDCRDMEGWEEQCQTILRALTGLDYNEFFCFLVSVARRRIHALATWKQNTRNFGSHSCALSRPLHDANDQSPVLVPMPTECSFQTKDGSDIDRAPGLYEQDDRDQDRTSELCHHDGRNMQRTSEPQQHEEDVLNLSEGADLNGRLISPRHWSYCNVNHALFDLVCVSMVLRNMRQHVSTKLITLTDKHITGDSKCSPEADITVCELEKETKPCLHDNNENCSRMGDGPDEKSCSITSLLQEISWCLSDFGTTDK